MINRMSYSEFKVILEACMASLKAILSAVHIKNDAVRYCC